MLTVNTSSDGYTLGDASKTNGSGIVRNSFNGKYEYNKWYTFRLEHFVSEGKAMTKIYVDNKLVATSDNFYGKTTDGNEAPSGVLGNARFFSLMSADFTVYLDDILVMKEKIDK